MQALFPLSTGPAIAPRCCRLTECNTPQNQHHRPPWSVDALYILCEYSVHALCPHTIITSHHPIIQVFTTSLGQIGSQDVSHVCLCIAWGAVLQGLPEGISPTLFRSLWKLLEEPLATHHKAYNFNRMTAMF